MGLRKYLSLPLTTGYNHFDVDIDVETGRHHVIR